jgi:two-component system response regulator YesN
MDAELSTSLIAQRFHMSQSYVCQIFRTYAHTSMHAMITQLRIERACVLLGRPERNETIADVCKQVGYADAQYFTKVFRRIKGLTPSEYRDLVLKP